MNDNRIREISSSVDIRGLNLLDSQTTVGSLSENDEYSYDEMERFWFNSILYLVNFITCDDKVNCYAGQVQYFLNI